MKPGTEWPEIGHDDLDVVPTRPPGRGWLPYRRLALGARPSAAPTTLFLLTGAALGPQGFNVLSSPVITRSQALVWVGLAVTGIFVGLGLASRSATPHRHLLVAASIAALATIGVMTGGFYLLASSSTLPLPGLVGVGSILVALCASVSAAVPTSTASSPELLRASRLADIDDLPLLAGGVLVIAALTGEAAALRVVATVMAGAAIGVAGWLLFSRASDTERGLFVTGAVLMLAGTGAYLGTSPLVSGCAAAIVWSRAPGPTDRITAHDLRALQHPLVALILIFAGAAIDVTLVAVWAAALILVLRLTTKLLVSVVIAGLESISPSVLASILLQPGVLGVAMALNAWLVLGDDYRWVLSAVSIATVASEALVLFVPRVSEETA
jgi:hypothetical protein